ncbi:YcnI family protein [Marinicrinis lubricantis]|uniref:YcnI family protein n=1 Tax=Marinicrinis lubricantis TaxID=2086470 RepID=A0ABW1ITZ9_9BACL
MMKKSVVYTAVFFIMMLFASTASAHVVVYPKETVQGTYEKFTVRVPSEEEASPTIKVEIAIPAEVNITRFEPKSGWSYEITRDDTDKITSVVWTAEEQGLSYTEFADFNMQGKVDEEAQEIVWKAYQTYENGTTVEWIGAPDADKPASVTAVTPGSPESDGHGHGQTAADSEDENGESSNDLPLYVSIGSAIVSVAALIIAFTRKKA